jgi:hypothetical protein
VLNGSTMRRYDDHMSPSRKQPRKKTPTRRRWSGAVTKHSDALDLEEGVFKKGSPRQIALSLKRSAETSTRRKSSPYRSAMSMLTFYINRAGKTLNAKQRRLLDKAKEQLRKVFGRERPPVQKNKNGQRS